MKYDIGCKILSRGSIISAAAHRIEWGFDVFSSMRESFSGEKYSTIFYHISQVFLDGLTLSLFSRCV